jgi:hypothetical protein
LENLKNIYNKYEYSVLLGIIGEGDEVEIYNGA